MGQQLGASKKYLPRSWGHFSLKSLPWAGDASLCFHQLYAFAPPFFLFRKALGCGAATLNESSLLRLDFVFKYCFGVWVGFRRSNPGPLFHGMWSAEDGWRVGLAETELVEVKGEPGILSFGHFDPANPLYF